MAQQQREDSESKGDLFDQGLTKEPLEKLEQLIEELEDLSDQPLELLQDFKRRVDARIEPEPIEGALSMSDSHAKRVRCWKTIANRLEAEIKWRSRQDAKSSPAQSNKTMRRQGPDKEPAVAARRIIVQQNKDLSDVEICKLLDHERIRLPKRWPEAGIKSWTEALYSRGRRIHVIFSKDRSSS